MAVAADTILEKMQRELTEARKAAADDTAIKQHAAKIKLLCELLTDQHVQDAEHDMTDREMKAMMGVEAAERQTEPAHGSFDHDNANGKSLFDF